MSVYVGYGFEKVSKIFFGTEIQPSPQTFSIKRH